MMDEQDNQAGVNAKMPGGPDMSWQATAHRELALVKAVESRKENDDDHDILARAGRFLNFLQKGT